MNSVRPRTRPLVCLVLSVSLATQYHLAYGAGEQSAAQDKNATGPHRHQTDLGPIGADADRALTEKQREILLRSQNAIALNQIQVLRLLQDSGNIEVLSVRPMGRADSELKNVPQYQVSFTEKGKIVALTAREALEENYRKFIASRDQYEANLWAISFPATLGVWLSAFFGVGSLSGFEDTAQAVVQHRGRLIGKVNGIRLLVGTATIPVAVGSSLFTYNFFLRQKAAKDFMTAKENVNAYYRQAVNEISEQQEFNAAIQLHIDNVEKSLNLMQSDSYQLAKASLVREFKDQVARDSVKAMIAAVAEDRTDKTNPQVSVPIDFMEFLIEQRMVDRKLVDQIRILATVSSEGGQPMEEVSDKDFARMTALKVSGLIAAIEALENQADPNLDPEEIARIKGDLKNELAVLTTLSQ